MELTYPIVRFTPFPKLETERLVLRRITPADVIEVYAIRSDAETMRYIPRPLARSKEDVLDFMNMIDKGILDNKYIHWAICFKEDLKLIGMICLIEFQPENFRTEVGYILAPDKRGLGVMTEALSSVINYALHTLGFHSLQAIIAPENIASERVLLRSGFVKEAHFKECRYYNGKFTDDAVYSLLNKPTFILE
jgi:ribosomal-protein-alanine N-acetyltransferase